MYRANLRRLDRKKIVEVWKWYTNENSGPEKCKGCKQFQEIRKETIDCHNYKGSGVACDNLPPVMDHDEEDFLGFWRYICNQWRVGMGGAYALDYTAIIGVADKLGFDLDEIEMRRLKALESYEVEKASKDG